VGGGVIADLMPFHAPLPNQIIPLRIGICPCNKKNGLEVSLRQLPQDSRVAIRGT